MDQNPQSQLKLLVIKGKEQGYLTYAEVNDHLPAEIVDSEQVEDIIQMINDMGIKVVETAPDADDLALNDDDANIDEDAAEAAAAALSSVESEIGRTTDPVRTRATASWSGSPARRRSTGRRVPRRTMRRSGQNVRRRQESGAR